MCAFRIAECDLLVNGGRATLVPKKKASKYLNKKTEVDGVKYDSRREAHRGAHLTWLQKAGKIAQLRYQVVFVLIPAQSAHGRKERACTYVADFVYDDLATGRCVVEDVKSVITRKKPEYVIKRKLMLERYGIAVQEIL